jgi:hypothetical protein
LVPSNLYIKWLRNINIFVPSDCPTSTFLVSIIVRACPEPKEKKSPPSQVGEKEEEASFSIPFVAFKVKVERM